MAREIIEECSHCGNKVRGELEQTFSRKVTRGAVKKGSVTAASTVAGAAIGSVVPIAGTAVGAAIGFATGVVAGAVMDDKVNKVSDDFEDILFDNATFNFVCPNCGNSWKSEYSNNNKDCEYRPVNQDDDDNEGLVPLTSSTVRRIKQTIANLLDCDVEDIISTKDLEDDLNADDDDKQYIIDDLEAEFDITISKTASDITFVDDLIECVTGESIWEEDEKYEDAGIEDREKDEAISRLNSFIDSYVNDEYKDMEITKLANMFENEAIESPNSIIQSQYYCLAAVSRIEFFLKEWFDNGFKNYSVEEQLIKLDEQCITNGIGNIQKAISLLPDDKEYLLIYGILNMLNDYFVECKEDKDEFNKKYAHYADKCKDCDNSMFNMEWLVGLYNKVYDSLLTCFETDASEESADDNDAEKEYLDNLRELLEDDAEITPRERKMLNRIRQKLGISEERAKELEALLSKPQLTEDEQEYLDMYREYAEKGSVTEKERRRLDKFAAAMGISENRAKEIESL